MAEFSRAARRRGLMGCEPSAIVSSQNPGRAGRQITAGTVRLFAAEALVVPTGLLTAAFLTRRLGPELYGVFTVAASIVVWAEMAAAMLLSRTAIKFVAEADDWAPVAGHFIRLQLVISLLAAALLVAGAPVLAAWLRVPALSAPLRLLAVDIPFFAMAALHRAFLIGRGAFSRAAAPAAAHWLVRFSLILLLVGLGLSVAGAILATIAGSAAALMLLRLSVRVPLWSRRATLKSHVWGYAPYLFLSALAIQLFSRLDLLMVAALSAPGVAGLYGAAQNLAIGPGLLAGSFSPLLLSTLTTALRNGDPTRFREMTVRSFRACMWLLPFVAVGAAAAPEVATLVYGPIFAASGSVAPILIMSAMAFLFLSVSGAICTALGQPRLTLAFAVPLIPAAAVGHLVVVPHFGGEGAALVTATVAWVGAAAATVTMLKRSGSTLPHGTLLRVLFVTVSAYFLARAWEMPGVWVLVELPLMAGLILAVLWKTGELRSLDLLSVGIPAWWPFRAAFAPHSTPGRLEGQGFSARSAR